MALYKKAEFAAECKVDTAYISVMLKRGKVIEDDGKIDSTDPINQAFIRHQQELAAKRAHKEDPENSGKTPKMAEFIGKTPKKLRQNKTRKQATNSAVSAVVTEKFNVELDERRARTAKAQQEMQLLKMKEQKLSGQLIPTELVANTLRQLLQSVMVSFSDGADALIVDIAKSLKIDRERMADLRKRLKHITNEAVNRSVTDAQKNIQNIVQEHSQRKGQTLF